ncbi:DUF4974 domain-containing protein [Dysgonomonas sp. 521]|uniref:FecR family protein n=1 Tax=Dysgonomonas sp. 521 TaxID=2302932 RepID=UPI0013D61304|nr:FecR family protein [Dysgonomonas sp. 521]NDV95358.1 DUF4974 domain-containing protein [Dysgonomonas sp. 521]
MNRERFEDLIYKFHNKQLNSEEKAEFEYFLTSFDEAREIFHDWNLVHQASEALSIHKNIPEISIPSTRVPLFTGLRRWVINTAAVISIPLILGLTYLLIDKYSHETLTYNEITAANAKVVNITLSDGSKVSLYAGSTLKYPNQFENDERLIKLNGEATFEVKSNPKNPFYVETSDGTRVKAYGTKFSVRDYNMDKTISVYLERGVVDFMSPQLSHSVTMKPDTKLIFDKVGKKYIILNTTPNEYDAYEQGVLLFNNKPLEEVVQKLSKVYNTEIIIEDESLREYNFTATIKDESIYQIMDMLSISSPQLEWKKEDQKIILTKKLKSEK